MCSVSIVSFYYLSSFSSVSPFLTPTPSAFDSVSAFCFSRSSISAFSIRVSASLFPVYRSRISILSRSRSCRLRSCRLRSSSSTSFRSRHPNNMSPIMTFLVSGLLFLFGVTSPLSCFCLDAAASPFILGFLAMSPVPFMASCFSAGVASPWVRRPPQNFSSFKALRRHRLPSLGLEIPAKLHFLFLLISSRPVTLYQSSYRSSTLRVLSSFRHLLYWGILSPTRFYVSVILDTRSSSCPLA